MIAPHPLDNPQTVEDRRAMATPIPATPKLKKCKGPCAIIVEFERAAEFFDADKNLKSGFKSICKACRAEQRVMRESSDALRRLDHIDDAVLNRLANARMGGPNVPHSADLLERVYSLIGGVNGMAALLMKTYITAKPGSPTQQKILGQIITLTQKVTDSGHAKKPIDLLTDDEVDAEIERLLRMKRLPPQSSLSLRILPEGFDEDSDLKESTE